MSKSQSSLIHHTAHLHSDAVLEDNVEVGPGVIFSGACIVRQGVKIGAGAVIGADIEIGFRARIEPGTVVLASVPANAIALGNPAQITGYTHETPPADAVVGDRLAAKPVGNRKSVDITPLQVGGAALYHMPNVLDLRGSLTVGEMDHDLPFVPQRYFAVFDVPSEKLRGEHAHHACHQFLICLSGSCMALLDDGKTRQEVLLDRPDVGLYMPPLIWGTQYKYSKDAVLLVFASAVYDPDDYIRDYDSFRAVIAKQA